MKRSLQSDPIATSIPVSNALTRPRVGKFLFCRGGVRGLERRFKLRSTDPSSARNFMATSHKTSLDPFLGELKRAQWDGQRVLAASAQRRPPAGSGHPGRVEQHRRVVELPVLGPDLPAAAGNVRHQAE